MPALINNGTDLKTVYMLAFDAHATDPVTIEQETDGKINVRFARELLGVLTKRKILVESEIDGEVVWQVNQPGSADEVDRDDAEAFITEWLGLAPKAKATPAKKATTKKATAVSGAKPANTTADGDPCLCGCGEATGKKSNYRPGHDARHAGVIGRLIGTESYNAGSVEVDEGYGSLQELPTDALRAKALGIAEKTLEKLSKGSKKDAKPEAGYVTVGKGQYDATRYPDGKIVYTDSKGKDKTASAAASKTFQPKA